MHTRPTLRTSAFKQVDVFTAEPMRGNALAVVFDAEGLSDAAMQAVAAWTNLSETVFVLPPTAAGADYRIRIFTPRSELPFAGHPSVGTAHALLESERIARKPELVQECLAGLLPVSVEGGGAERRIFVRSPTTKLHAPDASLAEAARAALKLGHGKLYARVADNGPKWLLCDIGEAAHVRTLAPDFAAVAEVTRELDVLGMSVFGRSEEPDAPFGLVVRTFCPRDGIPEDPVTGSANAAIGAHLWASGALAAIGHRYRVSQGREVGRDGYVDVRVDEETGAVDIGGSCVTCIDGTLALPSL
ncbi:MAG TPA: PhzF family phenazine biosynthesis protein [Rudaea sp.]|nr:PhzF family phenazine biosynthesis protein [Rudaea sp.]